MDLYRRARNYVGSDGTRVELSPATKGKRWFYRFVGEKNWRDAKDKFWALLEAARLKGKSGAEMAFEPYYVKAPTPRDQYKKREPRYSIVTMAIKRAEAQKGET